MQPSIEQCQPIRWPAEWEPHARTWIAWPHQRDDWPGKFEAIPWVYVEIIRHLHLSEEVGLLVNDAESETAARAMLERAEINNDKIAYVRLTTDRVWTRDTGPIFVQSRDEGAIALDWRFTGWAKYPNHLNDDAVPGGLARQFGWKLLQPLWSGRRIVLEGGSIDGNGDGVLLTTEECLLSDVQCRNPGFTRADYERALAEYLGISQVIWLNRGIVGDDTHGHVDDLTRFVAPNRVVTIVESNSTDPNYELLQENFERLRSVKLKSGEHLEVVTLPMPDPVVFDGQRLPASYANFYIANDRILVPTFNSPQDRVALGILAELFPNRKVVGIHAVDLVWGLGTLHCLTQQQPA